MEYNIAIIGNGNDGKTAYINKISNGYFTQRIYGKTTISFHSNISTIKINFFEENEPNDINFSKIDGLILMFDLQDASKLNDYISKIDLPNKKFPKVLVGNKYDLLRIEKHNGIEIEYFGDNSKDEIFENYKKNYSNLFEDFSIISVVADYNIYNPLLAILNKLTSTEIQIV